MPFRNRRRRAPRRRFNRRKFPRRPGYSRRFKSKRFVRGIPRFQGQVIPPTMMIKLPYVNNFQYTLAAGGTAGDTNADLIQGNAIVPFCSQGQVGTPTGVGNVPIAGDQLPADFYRWAGFYDRYYVMASKIKIEAVFSSVETTGVSCVQVGLLARPFSSFSSSATASVDNSWPSLVTSMAALEYKDLVTYPYSKTRMISTSAGGNSRLFWKMFRKTKRMYGVKDVRDNEELQGYLFQAPDATAGFYDNVNPHHGFFYYFRFYNVGQACVVNYTLRMTLYINLTQRVDIEGQEI